MQMVAALAMQRKVSKAKVIREVFREGVREVSAKKMNKKSAGKTLLGLSGVAGSGPKDLSETMDEYLYGSKSRYAK